MPGEPDDREQRLGARGDVVDVVLAEREEHRARAQETRAGTRSHQARDGDSVRPCLDGLASPRGQRSRTGLSDPRHDTRVGPCPTPFSVRCVRFGATSPAGSSAASAGARSSQTCPSCGTPNAPGVKFCGECGTALTATAPAPHSRGRSRAGSRAPPRLGALRRPRRLHAALGAARRRGGARAPLALLRDESRR